VNEEVNRDKTGDADEINMEVDSKECTSKREICNKVMQNNVV